MWDLQHAWQIAAGVSNDRSEAFLWPSNHWLTGSENDGTAILPIRPIRQSTQRNNPTKPESSDLRPPPLPPLSGAITRILFFNKCRCHIRTSLEETRTDLEGRGIFK
jgi:hypothetical protein